jgi:large conductance mechanosensitive channel
MKNFLQEFRDFAMKGNVIDLAVGVVIGASFGKIVSSLVEDIIMPPLSFIIGHIDFKDLVWKFNYQNSEVVVMNYGKFINASLNFLIVAAAIFIVVRVINRYQRTAPAQPPTKQEVLLAEIRDLLKNSGQNGINNNNANIK